MEGKNVLSTIPFGKFKGYPINDMDKDYMKKFVKYKRFTSNKGFMDRVRKSKFSYLVKGKSKKKGSLRKPKKTVKKKYNKLMYFYMDNCGWCDRFTPTWRKLIKENNRNKKVNMVKINGPNNLTTATKYGVVSYPTIILLKDNKPYKYDGDRSLDDLLDFIN